MLIMKKIYTMPSEFRKPGKVKCSSLRSSASTFCLQSLEKSAQINVVGKKFLILPTKFGKIEARNAYKEEVL